MPTNPEEQAAPAVHSGSFSVFEPLPIVRSSRTPSEAMERLALASRRGRLAGFQRDSGNTFRATLFSEPFDHELLATVDEAPGGSAIHSRARMLPRLPVIFAVVLILTVYPGVLLTDSMIPGEWGWIDTWIWYIPLTALPLPWIWARLMKKCRAAAGASAFELLHKIAAEVEGHVEPASR